MKTLSANLLFNKFLWRALFLGILILNSLFVSAQNLPPAVAITFPVSYQTYIEGPMTITATASDPDGTIARVVFYFDNDSIGKDLTAPYSFTHYMHPKPEEGAKWYVKARAYDNGGLYTEENIPFFITANTCSLTIPETTRQIICAGDSLHIGTEASTGANAVQWYWQTGEESWDAIIGDTIHSYYARQTGNYRAVWTYTNTATCTTAVDTVSIFLLVTPLKLDTLDKLNFVVQAKVDYSNSDQKSVNFFLDSDLIYSDLSSPFLTSMSGSEGFHSITAELLISESAVCQVKVDSVFLGTNSADDLALAGLAIDSADPDFIERLNSFEKGLKEFIDNQTETNDSSLVGKWISQEVLTIPVVFGIIRDTLNTISNYVTDALIHENLATINSIYKRNKLNTPFGQKYIQLCLARNKPNGDTFDGIVRINNNLLSAFPGGLKGPEYAKRMKAVFNGFSYRNYLRIVITNRRSGTNTISSSYPFSYLGSTTELEAKDGVYMHYEHLGPSISIPNNLNRGIILGHELGHWLELHHTFSPNQGCAYDPLSGCNAIASESLSEFYKNCDSVGFYPSWDFVKDTPPMEKVLNGAATINLSNLLNSCSNLANGPEYQCDGHVYSGDSLKKAAFNIMNYGPNQCVDADTGWALTTGQRERVFFALNYCRSYIFQPSNYVFTGVECVPAFAHFDMSHTVACGTGANAKIVITPFVNPSLPVATTHYYWSLNESPGIGTYSIANNNGSALPDTLTFNTANQRPVQLTLTLITGTDTLKTSRTIGIHPDCEGSGDYRSHLFFGRSAGLKTVGGSRLPSADTSSILRNNFYDRLRKVPGSTVTISDSAGNLKYYAMGRYLFSSSHVRLTGGLFADSNSSQYGISIRKPGASNIYLLFTVPSAGGTYFNKGLRMHTLYPASPGSNTYNAPVTAGPSGAPTGDNGSILVSEKITLVPKCPQYPNEYWLVVQGPANDATWGKRFYVYSLTSGGIVYSNYYNAYDLAPKGVLKASPERNLLVSTYSTVNAGTGYGTGAFARTFVLNPENGGIYPHKKLIQTGLPSGVSSLSSFGASFNAASNWVYLNVNQKKDSASGTQFQGIYRYALGTDTATTVTGSKISSVPIEYSPSQDLMLTSSGKILLSTTRSPAYNTETEANDLGKELGIIYCPENATDPGLLWNTVPLTLKPNQVIYPSGYLCNFVDAKVSPVALPDSGLTDTDPWRLGINPQACCPVPYVMNVACTGNEDQPTTTGNDIYYEVTLTKINGEFKNLVVSSGLSEFPTSIHVKIFSSDTNDIGIVYPSGNGQQTLISHDEIIGIIATDNTAHFQIIVNANSLGAVGNFRTKIYTEFPNPEDNIANCCRMAVDGTDREPIPAKPRPITVFAKANWKMYPNPAFNSLSVETEDAGTLDIFDLFGRKVVSGVLVEDRAKVSIDQLPAGMYQVRFRTLNGSSIQALSIQK